MSKVTQYILIFLIILMLGFNIINIIFKEDKPSSGEKELLTTMNKKLDSFYVVQGNKLTSLQTSTDSLKLLYKTDRKKLQDTKHKRDEDINVIRNMDYDSLYSFFAKR